MKNTRKLTYKTSQAWGTGYPEYTYPELRISGKFLTEKYGLNIGDVVGMEYKKNEIVIKTGRR